MTRTAALGTYRYAKAKRVQRTPARAIQPMATKALSIQSIDFGQPIVPFSSRTPCLVMHQSMHCYRKRVRRPWPCRGEQRAKRLLSSRWTLANPSFTVALHRSIDPLTRMHSIPPPSQFVCNSTATMAEDAAAQQQPVDEPEQGGDAGTGFKVGEWNELIGEDIEYKVRVCVGGGLVGLCIGMGAVWGTWYGAQA